MKKNVELLSRLLKNESKKADNKDLVAQFSFFITLLEKREKKGMIEKRVKTQFSLSEEAYTQMLYYFSDKLDLLLQSYGLSTLTFPPTESEANHFLKMMEMERVFVVVTTDKQLEDEDTERYLSLLEERSEVIHLPDCQGEQGDLLITLSNINHDLAGRPFSLLLGEILGDKLKLLFLEAQKDKFGVRQTLKRSIRYRNLVEFGLIPGEIHLLPEKIEDYKIQSGQMTLESLLHSNIHDFRRFCSLARKNWGSLQHQIPSLSTLRIAVSLEQNKDFAYHLLLMLCLYPRELSFVEWLTLLEATPPTSTRNVLKKYLLNTRFEDNDFQSSSLERTIDLTSRDVTQVLKHHLSKYYAVKKWSVY